MEEKRARLEEVEESEEKTWTEIKTKGIVFEDVVAVRFRAGESLDVAYKSGAKAPWEKLTGVDPKTISSENLFKRIVGVFANHERDKGLMVVDTPEKKLWWRLTPVNSFKAKYTFVSNGNEIGFAGRELKITINDACLRFIEKFESAQARDLRLKLWKVYFDSIGLRVERVQQDIEKVVS